MRYKIVGTDFFCFVTIYAFDRQTDISLVAKTALLYWLHRCSVVKIGLANEKSDPCVNMLANSLNANWTEC